jgi:hypothetical protein
MLFAALVALAGLVAAGVWSLDARIARRPTALTV